MHFNAFCNQHFEVCGQMHLPDLMLHFRLPPGPWGYPLYGVASQLAGNKLQHVLKKWKDVYGDIFCFSLPGGHQVVVVCEFVKEYVSLLRVYVTITWITML